jgi:TolB-like protein/tetratricopeptide (TPR) repeat protein
VVENAVQRRLAAILAADVVGYSRLMGEDETGTLARLKVCRRDLIDPAIAKFHGRIVKLMGDGVLVEFASAVDAVECAAAIQRAMATRDAETDDARRIRFRIGVNLGDVIVDGDDIYGDGVNIAARLEAMAEPGGIYVSATVHDHVLGKLALPFDDLGEHTLKNIAKPIRVYGVVTGGTSQRAERPTLALPDKPSIAVLPFQNMSGDPEQEYFADGMVEDIITGLSRFNALFVIARNSSFTYKGRAVDIKQVGRELGVRYVLEGSVRKSGNRVRITGQLIDTSTGSHLWADRFDGLIEDIFDLQDHVTANVVGAIAPKLEQVEIERAKRKPTDRLDAYDYYLRGMADLGQWTREANADALANFTHALERDPNFAAAYGNAARCYVQRKAAGWSIDRDHEIVETERLAKLAVKYGREDAVALCTAGMALSYVVGDLENGNGYIDQAIHLNPNMAWAWMFSGWINAWRGKSEMAIERAKRAIRLSPHDTQMFAMQSSVSLAHYFAGRYEEALSWAEAAIRDQPKFLIALCIASASYALTGRTPEAEKAMANLRQLDPALRLSNLGELMPIARPGDFAMLFDGLSKAGLPH